MYAIRSYYGIYFNKNNRYDNVGAYNSKSSPYYSWYSFIKYPDVYESWWGIDTLPNVNESDKDFSEYICGDKGVLKYWLSLGASGFRLDVADELPDSFLDLINRCVKDDSQQNLIIGEVWEDASNKESYGVKRRYLLGQQLDSVMNYPFKDAIIFYIKGGSPKIFNDWIMTILENYPKPSIDCLMNFLSTHDIQRAITVFGGQDADGQCKEWQAEKYLNEYEYINGKNLFKCAVVLQYFLPGVPCIYYGDEAGMQGYCDPFNRRCYPWGKEDNDLLDYFKKMGEYRAACSEYMTGRCEILVCENDYISFLRYNSNENKAVLITLNKSNNNIEANLGKMINSSFNYSKSITGSNNIFSHNINSRDFSIIELISKNN